MYLDNNWIMIGRKIPLPRWHLIILVVMWHVKDPSKLMPARLDRLGKI
jgi:hypothetical protein